MSRQTADAQVWHAHAELRAAATSSGRRPDDARVQVGIGCALGAEHQNRTVAPEREPFARIGVRAREQESGKARDRGFAGDHRIVATAAFGQQPHAVRGGLVIDGHEGVGADSSEFATPGSTPRRTRGRP